jgi:hypothetical protein
MTTSTAPTTCTVGPSAVTGERCGKPAVTTFTGRDGTVFAECAEHDASSTTTHAPRPRVTFRGIPFRTERSARFVLCRLTGDGKVVILKGSGSVEVLRAEARRRGFGGAGIVDLVTGEEVR